MEFRKINISNSSIKSRFKECPIPQGFHHQTIWVKDSSEFLEKYKKINKK